ncbi:scavenger receptor cysteine-rich type 1 protein M130-like isoform X1 [Asterias rubens]|uniref:scavenger receptor cysteine-rich type 1 protein M130-like isoform X1 n=1 Tax=Asterias rubens TaxID=7604 RepID=UPI0014557F33|nr:scavenger receptor cysteine-rich type 1 protein M130-like isoform X1 [Asterias rubens]
MENILLPAVVFVLLSSCTSQAKEIPSTGQQSQCVSGTYMMVSHPDEGHRCVADCGPGNYGDTVTKACQQCDSVCLTCVESPTKCTSCSEPNFLLGNGCVKDCGSKFSRGPARSRLRLAGGADKFEGRVEILHEGAWGTICDDDWDILDANVVCNELQFGSSAREALSISKTTFGLASSRMPIHLDDLKCRGVESKLDFCPHLAWGRHNCAHNEDAAVRCAGPDQSRLCVTSCGDGFYQVPGTNRCELCDSQCLTCTDRPYLCLSCDAPRFLQKDKCVENCGSGMHGNTLSRTCEACHGNCNNCFDGETDDVCSSCNDRMYLKGQVCVLSCDQLAKNLAIRLVGGVTEYEGRVEVNINGVWGTVCDDEWDINDAEVVCRELGYGSALAAVTAPGFSPGTGPVLMDYVQCKGSEAELVQCEQNDWGDNQCRHTEDAGVRCEGSMSVVSAWGTLVSTLTHPGATGRCVEYCGMGYYLPPTSDYDCATCSANCLDCEIEAAQCTSCKPSKFLKDSSCVVSCGSAEFGNNVTNRCESCDVTKCGSCLDGTRDDNCKSCQAGKVLKGSSCMQSCGPDMFSQAGVCQEACDHGYYGNPASFICQTCSEECLTCEFNAEYSIVCKTCIAPKLFYNGQCLDICPDSMLIMLMDQSLLPNSEELRLVGGQDQIEGRLEVFHEGQWGSVCSDRWSLNAANVACGQLNLGRADSILGLGSSMIGPGEGVIWLDNVVCRGTESNLEDCHRNDWGVNNCHHFKDVAIRCSGPGIRECVTTCPQGFYPDSLTGQCVLCRKDCLQCVNEPGYQCTRCKAGTLLDGNDCVDECKSGYHPDSATETCVHCDDNCATCAFAPGNCTSCIETLTLEGHTCVPECDGYTLVLTDKFRLVGGSSSLEGRVEVRYDQDNWGTVCDDQWGLDDADVVCAELGLGKALRAVEHAGFGEGTGLIVLDNVMCNGDETSLLACEHAGIGINNCQHDEDAGVVCSGPITSNICIRQEDCSAGFFIAADDKICGKCSANCMTCARSADECTGCPEGQFLTREKECVDKCPDGYYGDVAGNCQACGPDCEDCSGSATECTSCASPLYLQLGKCVAVCDSNMYVKKGPSDIRLVGGNNVFAGRIEVMYNGAWGTVCDDDFDTNDGNVVCKQLGMGYAIEAYHNAHFGEGTGTIALDELRCNGDESDLMDCTSHKHGVDEVDCQHYEDAGVQCSGPGSALHCLEDCGQGYYATSEKVCEHCNSECKTCSDSPTHCTSCTDLMFLSNDTCISNCPAGRYGNSATHQCQPCPPECQECFNGVDGSSCKSCKRGFYLEGSACVAKCHHGSILESVLPEATEILETRLAGGSEFEGRIEIRKEGFWGTVCIDDFDLIDGEIACQQLGLGSVVNVMSSAGYGGVALDTPIWMYNLDCQGWESSLSQCRHQERGTCRSGITSTNGDAAIRCDGSSYRRPPKNICRDVMRSPCEANSCNSGVVCVNLNHETSACMECPSGQIGNGKQCTLVANSPPEFERTPVDRISVIGSQASMPCRAKDGSAPLVTAKNWLKNNEPIPQVDLENGRVTALNFGSLFIDFVRREDMANYTCVIRNTQGELSATALLTVEESPQIINKRDATVAVGEDATLGCLVIGQPASDVTWSFRGQVVSGDRFTSNSNAGTLVIQAVTIEDEGEYQCFAENTLGSAFTVVKLTVQEPPKFTMTPKNSEVEQGQGVLIQCQAEGKPKPRIHWKKDGGDLPHVDNRYTIMPTGDLQIVNADMSVMGDYFCIAINPVQSSSLVATILVNGPPAFKVKPANQTLSSGETILLQCEVIGTNNPTVSWEKDGGIIKSAEHYVIKEDGLQLNSVTTEDSGTYKCIGSNREGVVESVAYINVEEPVYGKQQTVGVMWIFIVIIILLLLIVVVLVALFLRRRYHQQALFNHSRLNRSPKKSGVGLGVKFLERGNGSSYVEIKKQKEKDEREMQMQGIIEDVDLV